MQLTHTHHSPASHNKEIIIVCDHVSGPANAGSIFRLADAFGVQEIIFCGNTPDVTSSRLRKTARNTERTVRFRESENITTTLINLREEGFNSIALEIDSTSIPIAEVHIANMSKISLVIGAESTGVTPEALKQCAVIAHIPMHGINSSMNVAQAAGIALYELTR
ncbi:TrmH family RNA methyltransferase [Dokdonia donghaensis]|uniref:tRNA/rRNA methyltransferase SpoU type domain-containing protein n=1 Tax=Dokdonia donghaensis DSW-1 TaxID=1300343 RepID=A0A0A2GQU8_9FLAO|nr:TrmH family RNA methyltransferase [Dokdonia donghaensis]ANH61108.1 tRNA (guanosine(18)-2'-O)-methyltransferase [Dokdonia donghaensis DSW-1]KGO05674.1 hypothetical protein NV36_01620 [Dokdonia donghaensis DSW-1]